MKTRFSLKALALGIAAAILFTMSANAQSNLSSAKNVTLKLDLRNVLEFTINAQNSSVIFDEVSEYSNGNDTTEAAAFTISSNLPFKIEVVSQSDNFSNGAGKTIPLSVMKIQSAGNSDNDASTANVVSLSKTTVGELLRTTTGCITRTYDIKYTATPTATGSSANNEFLANPTGVYSATLLYTITQL